MMAKTLFSLIVMVCLFMAPRTTTAQSADEAEVLALVNAERAAAGQAALAWDSCLAAAAQTHNNDMIANSFFDHTSPTDGSTPSVRAANAGSPATAIGENIAWGQPTPAAVMADWMASTGHRNNILRSNYTHIGISRVGSHWTQVFGNAACSGGGGSGGSGGTGGTSGTGGSGSTGGTSGGVPVTVDPTLCGGRVQMTGNASDLACRTLDAAGVGNADVIAQGIVQAVDIWGQMNGSMQVCLTGTGRMIFLSAAQAPRIPTPIPSYRGVNGTTCATLSTPGTLVLVGGQPSASPAPNVVVTPAPVPGMAAPPVTNPATGQLIHVVQRGENLFRIGLRYNVPYQEIAALNGIDNSWRIYAGQTLLIPAR